MDCFVPKIGALFFDALHTYGLGILLATASGLPVTLQDEGIGYRLSTSFAEAPPITPDVLDTILRLPTVEEFQVTQPAHTNEDLSRANLDGLLASLRTQSGIHLVSVADLVQKQQYASSVLEEGLRKVQQATAQWKTWVVQRGKGSPFWLRNLLQAYQPAVVEHPVLRVALKQDMSIWMTLDPSLGSSTRRPWSDGFISQKTTLTLRGQRYGVLLARIGAARFLRAQPVASHLINYYLPLATSLTLYPESALPVVSSFSLPSEQALLAQWLSYVRRVPPLKATWQGLAYQILETQGVKQAISMQSGVLSFAWIKTITERVGYDLIRAWRWYLTQHQEATPYALDLLLTCLKTRQANDWTAHLRDFAWAVYANPPGKVRGYSLAECKELTMVMISPTTSPLRSIFERKQGTLRFGHALRLLGQVNRASLKERLESLESVSSLETLLQILQQAVQDCALASAKSPFIVVPTDDDLKFLLDDVAQYGVRLVASLLLILSALHYPVATTPAAAPDPQPLPSEIAAPETMLLSELLPSEEGVHDDVC